MFYVDLLVCIIYIHMITLGSPCKRNEVLVRVWRTQIAKQEDLSRVGRTQIGKQWVMARVGRIWIVMHGRLPEGMSALDRELALLLIGNPYQNFSLNFSHLPNTITFSYKVRIGWFKLEIVHKLVLYLIQVVLHSFDWVFKWFYPENRDSLWFGGISLIFVISSFITFNLIEVSSSICTCMFCECYWER